MALVLTQRLAWAICHLCDGIGLQKLSATHEGVKTGRAEPPWQAGRHGHCKRGLGWLTTQSTPSPLV